MNQELKHQITELQGSIEDIYNRLGKELIKCPKCGGSGSTYDIKVDDDGYAETCSRECLFCNKKGKVWVSSNYFNIYEEETKPKGKTK